MDNDDLLTALREKREALHKEAKLARQVADDAEDKYRAADDAIAMFDEVKREQDAFNKSAADILTG
jgi:hypothetical protein